MGRGNNSFTLRPYVMWGVEMKQPPMEGLQGKLLHQVTKDFAQIKEVTGLFRKKFEPRGLVHGSTMNFRKTDFGGQEETGIESDLRNLEACPLTKD